MAPRYPKLVIGTPWGARLGNQSPGARGNTINENAWIAALGSHHERCASDGKDVADDAKGNKVSGTGDGNEMAFGDRYPGKDTGAGHWGFGPDGNDRIDGQKGIDRIDGSGGNDRIQEGADDNGTDVVSGGDRDVLRGEDGRDIMGGADSADVAAAGGNDDHLYGYGKELFFGVRGDDSMADGTIYGTKGNDVLVGDNGANFLAGELGNDKLDGGYGRDTLVGGTGNDSLAGGPDNDRLTGGPGADYFVFRANDVQGSSDTDTITDFSSKEEDKIVLSDLDKNDIKTINIDTQTHDVTIELKNGQKIILTDAEDSFKITFTGAESGWHGSDGGGDFYDNFLFGDDIDPLWGADAPDTDTHPDPGRLQAATCPEIVKEDDDQGVAHHHDYNLFG